MNQYYEILWLKDWASLEEVKEAYRKLSMKNHPDQWWSDHLFKLINNAYQKLLIWFEEQSSNTLNIIKEKENITKENIIKKNHNYYIPLIAFTLILLVFNIIWLELYDGNIPTSANKLGSIYKIGPSIWATIIWFLIWQVLTFKIKDNNSNIYFLLVLIWYIIAVIYYLLK